jgi:hypothetical protein
MILISTLSQVVTIGGPMKKITIEVLYEYFAAGSLHKETCRIKINLGIFPLHFYRLDILKSMI